MKKRHSDQKQQCFIEDHFSQLQNQNLSTDFHADLLLNVHKQLPANQLRNIGRPQTMIPRTLAFNKLMCKLPSPLNLMCNQEHFVSKTGSNRLKIANKQKLTIQEYFCKKQFKEVYNRLSNFPSDSKNFTGKILSIDSVADYNNKIFRQLQSSKIAIKQQFQNRIDADFQSGNLCRAYVSNSEQNEYFLMIENDINTHGYNIWFFFRFRNKNKGIRTFNLLNMIKKTDNFKKGMQISVFSMKKHLKNKTMWHKCGDKINFGETNFSRMFHLTEKYYYLTFQYDFQEDQDEVYFALNQPYTYSRMIQQINLLHQNKINNDVQVQIKIIGHTLADNVIPAVKFWKGTLQNKQTILITARQHPCQTVSSFVCEGMMKHIINESQQIKFLLERYQIVFIPMVNPDGVIHGSSRCNLAGFDVNRQWSQFLIKQFTPQTYRIKKYINSLHKQNPIKYFFDIHGHGKKLNSFLFSCKRGDNQNNRLVQLSMNKLEPRFSILDCTYGIDRDKQNTVRSQLNQMGIQNCYTLENSLMGYMTTSGEIEQYKEEDLFHIGQSLWKSIFVLDHSSEIVKQVLGFSKQELLQSSATIIQKISQNQKQENKRNMFDDNASDSDPEGDILDINQRIQTCCKNNTNLKKKLTQNLKIQKIKKKKSNNLRGSTKKQERKNSTNSSNQSASILERSVKVQNATQKKQSLQKEQTLSEEKQKLKKMSLNNKRTIYSKKIKQKRQTLKQTKINPSDYNENLNKTQVRKIKRQSSNFSQIKFRNQRLKSQLKNNIEKARKTACSVIYEYPNQGMLSTKRKMSYKMKTQGSIPFNSEKQIPGIIYYQQQSKNQLKYSQLKQESLKSLLNDTFSILKIKPKLSIKRYVKINPYQKQKKQMVLMTNNQKAKPLMIPKETKNKQTKKKKNAEDKIQTHNISHRTSIIGKDSQFTKTEYGMKLPVKRTFSEFKYRRFQSFIQNRIATEKSQSIHNSVFYYFPVL